MKQLKYKAVALVLAVGLLLSGCAGVRVAALEPDVAASEAAEGKQESVQETPEAMLPDEVQKQESAQPSKANPISVQPLLNEFETVDTDGEKVTQDIFADKKLTMVYVWATYCGPCISALPDMEELNNKYAEQGFQVVGILTDITDQEGNPIPDQVAFTNEIAAATGTEFTNLVPSVEIMRALADVSATPTTILVDSEGNQVGEWQIGKLPLEKWNEKIEGTLATLE